MFHRLAAPVIICLALVACGGEATPDQEVIEQAVQATLTAAASHTVDTPTPELPTDTPEPPTDTPSPTDTPTPAPPTDTPTLTDTPTPAPPTDTPTPTDTAAPPTDTPIPTDTPTPIPPTDTPTPIPTPTPIVLSGSGDGIVDISKGPEPALVRIRGNASAGFFAVTSYDSQGNYVDLLVNTTDPYEGVRPIDFLRGEQTSRFEVNAPGEWVIELLPLSAVERVQIPGEISGRGDYVFALEGGTPDTAAISGNASASFFAVMGYGDGIDLLVNTTEPYEGTVLVNPNTVLIEVNASDNWRMSISAR